MHSLTIVHLRESVLLSLQASVLQLIHAPLLADAKVRQQDGDVLFNLDRPIKDLPSPVTASLITVSKKNPPPPAEKHLGQPLLYYEGFI